MTFDPPPEDDDVSLVSGLSEKEAWLRLENERWAWHFLPWTQEEEPLDGERIVSFEAVRSVLFRVEDDELKLTLVMNTLRYLGALTASHPHSITPSQGRASLGALTASHPHSITPSQGRASLGALTASHPHSITPSQGRASLGALTASHPHSIRASLEDLTQLSSYTVSVFGGLLGDDLVFSSPISPAGLVCEDVGSLVDTLSDAMLGDTPPPTHPLLLATLCRLCQQCLSLLTSEHAQTVLGLVWTVNALRAALGDPAWRKLPQKIIKNLLKTHRDNLELWRCCALVEHVLGRDCLPVFLTLLSSSLSPRLVATLVEASLTVSTDRTVALNALLCLSEGSFSADSPVTPTRILKANFVCSNDAPASDVLYFGLCKAYCVYLTKGMSPACGVLDQLASSLSPHDALSVCVRQVRLCLQSPTTEPRYLRGILDSGLTVCPNHPWLLANRLRTEEQAVSVGRLTKESATTEGRLFALLQELRRLERVKAMSGSSIGGLRRALGLLESTVDTQPLLWRIYLVLQVSSLSHTHTVHELHN